MSAVWLGVSIIEMSESTAGTGTSLKWQLGINQAAKSDLGHNALFICLPEN